MSAGKLTADELTPEERAHADAVFAELDERVRAVLVLAREAAGALADKVQGADAEFVLEQATARLAAERRAGCWW